MTDVEKLILENQLVIMTTLRALNLNNQQIYDALTDRVIQINKVISTSSNDIKAYLVRNYADNHKPGETFNYKYTCSNCGGFIDHDLLIEDVKRLDKCPRCKAIIDKEYFKSFGSSSTYPLIHIDETTFPYTRYGDRKDK